MHLPYASQPHPTESQVISPFLASTPTLMPASPPPTAKLHNCPGSVPLSGSTHQLASQDIPFTSHSHLPESQVTSPFLVLTVLTHTLTPFPIPAVPTALTHTLTPALTSSSSPTANVHPLTPAPESSLLVTHTHPSTAAPKPEDIDPFLDPHSPPNENSPPTSVETSKPKFKLPGGQRRIMRTGTNLLRTATTCF